MSREELLKWLHNLPFNYIWPSSDWDDIGFTERPIWINSKGYGYLACDDPSEVCWEGSGVPLEKWSSIRDKLSKGKLLYSDIQGTSLVDLMSEIVWEALELDSNINDYLEGLLGLPDKELNTLYAMNSWDGWGFFSTEEEFKNAYERDWCDIAWDELKDDDLLEWHRRLTEML